LNKIHDAIKKAFEATETEYNDSVLQFIAINVTADFSKKVKNGKISVEDIQDSVESVLSKSGYDNVAKAYILYRKEREKLRNIKTTLLDYKETVNKYLHVEDWRVKENSTVTYSIGGLILSNSGAVTANYWLNEIYDKEIAEAHKNCDLHIHDLSMLTGYCAGWSLKQLIQQGLGIPGKTTSTPASHLSTLCNQMVNFIGCFTDDTRINLSDGTKPTIREMLDSGEKEWVVKSYDPKTDKVIDSRMHNLHKTRTVEEHYELEFDDGDKVKCTVDHKFWTLNRGWVEARDLTHEDNCIDLNLNAIHVKNKNLINETKDVYCGTVENDFHGFFVNDGKLVRNCLQNEWAGAQAFSSFDTYLAPFVKKDNLAYKEVKQCIQSLVFGLNTPSRWGCVDSETELLTVDGWKKFNEVSKGEQIYTWKDGILELNPINEVVVKNYTGKMHVYKGIGYEQMVSPDHRILFKHHNEEVYEIRHSSDIFNVKTPYPLPIMFEQSEIKDSVLSDDEVKLAAAIYTDGSIDIRNGSVHKIQIYKSPKRFGNELIIEASKNLGLEFSHYKKPSTFGEINIYAYYGENARRLYELVGSKKEISKKFLSLNKYQATIFLETWALFDGSVEKAKLQVDNSVIASQIQHIAILAGFCSYMSSTKKTNYIRLHRERHVIPSERYEVDYDGIIWCPNVENGTAVFRKNGNTFISGQCQSPFSNITLDWTVPKDIAPLPAIVGGKEMNFTYGECQKEMDMVNKAFIEIMIEGDANGRGFQYPIPTYSITRDFDWSETENNKLLFEMTSKYGTPYFSNYINSDMEPSDVRSMCVMPDTIVKIKEKSSGKLLSIPISEVFDKYAQDEYLILTRYGYKPVKEEYELLYSGKMVKVTTESGKILTTTLDHPWRVYDNRKHSLIEKRAENLSINDYVSARHESYFSEYNKTRKGKTFEEIYGYEKSEELKRICSERGKREDSFFNSKNNPSYNMSIEQRIAIGKGGIGHSVSEKCRKKSSERWKGDNNPVKKQSYWDKNRLFSAATSPYEINFACELEAIGLDYIHQYVVDGNVVDFYIPSKNLIVELETKYKGCTYNYENGWCKHRGLTGKERLNSLRKLGYNVLIFNPKENSDEYRKYINTVDKIKSIEYVDYNGYVYDVEIDTDGNYLSAHTFYANDILTGNCCRLRLDLRELRKKSGGFFGSGESTGSVGVVTINMPRIAYLSKNVEEFYERLDKLMDIAARSLDVKRKVITKYLEDGLYPYTKHYLGTFANHFSTIGLVGMNEVGLNAKWLRCDMTDERCQKFSMEVLDHMRERLSDYQEMYGDLYNLEATPAESTSYRLAKHDVETFNDIITAAEPGGTPYYTNSSHLPVGYTEDVFAALDVQDELQTRYTSGTVFHAFLGEKLPTWKTAMNLVRKIAENYKLPYYTLSPTYSVCKQHGYINGEQFKCPTCGDSTEVYSRITGYYRPVQNWNDGKAQEYKERKEYVLEHSHLTHEGCKCEEHKEESKAEVNEPILFASKTCPNCRIACTYLEKANFKYKKLFADENVEYATQLGVKQAPTLLIPDDNGGFMKYSGAGAIKEYLDKHRS